MKVKRFDIIEVCTSPDADPQNMSPVEPVFWGLYSDINDEVEMYRCANALFTFYDLLELPAELPTTQQINEYVDAISEIGSQWSHCGGGDSEVRQGLFFLLATHYNVDVQIIYDLW